MRHDRFGVKSRVRINTNNIDPDKIMSFSNSGTTETSNY